MNDQQLLQVADAAATSLPGMSFEHRESPHWETYKVAGKVFLLMTDLPGYPLITIKADPDDAVTLQEQYVEISAGYHTDKRHWVSVTAGSGIDDRVVRGLRGQRVVEDQRGLGVALLRITLLRVALGGLGGGAHGSRVRRGGGPGLRPP